MFLSMDSKNEPKYVMRLRQSHVIIKNRITGEEEKCQRNMLSQEIPFFLKYKHDVFFKNNTRVLSSASHPRVACNNYTNLNLLSMKDVNICRKVLENPIKIYDDGDWCMVKVNIKFVMKISDYNAKFGKPYDHENIFNMNLKEEVKKEPRISLTFHFKDKIDLEDLATVADYIYDQLDSQLKEIEFSNSYLIKDQCFIKVLLPIRLKQEVIKFMVNTFEVPNIGVVTLGPKNVVLEEVNVEKASESIKYLNWKDAIQLYSLPSDLFDKYNEDTRTKLLDAGQDYLLTKFKDRITEIIIDINNKKKEIEYKEEIEKAAIFEEEILDTYSSKFSIGEDYLGQMMNKIRDNRLKQEQDFMETFSCIFTSEEFKEGFKEVLNTLKNDNKEDEELQNMLEDVFKHINTVKS